MRVWTLLALLAAPPIAAVAQAQPAPPAPLTPPFHDLGTVTLRNATSLPLRQFFLWNQGFAAEGEERLGGEPLPAGGARQLALGMGQCGVSLRVVFADGSEERVRLVQLCGAGELVIEAGAPVTVRVVTR